QQNLVAAGVTAEGEDTAHPGLFDERAVAPQAEAERARQVGIRRTRAQAPGEVFQGIAACAALFQRADKLLVDVRNDFLHARLLQYAQGLLFRCSLRTLVILRARERRRNEPTRRRA